MNEPFLDLLNPEKAKQSNLYKTMIQTSIDGFWIVDMDGHFLDVNDSYCKMIGYSREELLKMKISDMEFIENREAVEAHIRKIKENGNDRFETRHRRIDNFIIDLEISVTYLENVEQMFVFVRDISKRKRDEEELKDSKALVEAVVENVPLMIFLKEATDLRFVIFNRAGEELLGYDRKDLLGKNNLDLFPPEQAENFMTKDREVLNGKEGVLDIPEEPIQTAKKGLRWLHTRKVCIRGADGATKYLLGISEDITERKLSEAELEKHRHHLEELIAEATETLEKTNLDLRESMEQAKLLAQEAQSANKAKSQFLANISHEIRTPMNAIIGFTELLQLSEVNEKQQEYLKIISESGKALISLINDILDISKIEADSMELEQIDFDLESLIQSLTKIIYPKLEKNQVALIFQYPVDLPHHFKGDPTRIRQIILNLLGNAAKFTEEGKIWVTVSQGVLMEEKKSTLEQIQITVKDTGIGIPKDKQNILFKLFSQVDASITRKFGGTGLGLFIAKTLALKMGGDITCQSTEGKGSEFILTLPLERSDFITREEISIISNENLKEIQTAILIDHESMRKMIQGFCCEAGMQVVFSTFSVTKFWDWLEKRGDLPKILIIDIQLPGLSEFDLVKKLKQDQKYQAIKLIAMTSFLRPGISKELQEAGYHAFVPKPILKKELIQVIRTTLGDQRQKNEIVTRHRAEDLSLKGVKILVAEDQETNQKLVKIYLEIFGCIGDFVLNGKEALEKIRHQQYDLCLMDIQMPVMDGIEATRILREEGFRMAVIGLSAAAVSTDKETGIASGMNDYLTKPLEKNKLKEMIFLWTQTEKKKDLF